MPTTLSSILPAVPPGAQGAQGAQGHQGVQGAQGVQGSQGSDVVVENSSATIYYPVISTSTTGALTPNVSTTKLQFQPSIGELSANIYAANSYVHYASNPSIATNVLTLDLRLANFFYVTLNANINTLTINNIEATNQVSSFAVLFTADGTARTVSWPVNFYWPSGTAPTLTSVNGKKDLFFFFTHDGGTNWYALTSGQNL
jgi:hypothetical protein